MGHSNPAKQTTQSGKKEIISDEEYIKRLRVDVASNCYPSCEGTHALLREYDKIIPNLVIARDRIKELEGDLQILQLQLEAAQNGNFTTGESESEKLQAQLEPLGS